MLTDSLPILHVRNPGTPPPVGYRRFIQRLFLPAYRRVTGRGKLDYANADLIFQGYCTRFLQARYWARDRLFRRPYKVVTARGEFGPELKYYLPYAYWHFLNGTLRGTASFPMTRELYFFSANHEEREGRRGYLVDPEVPNSEDHNFSYSYRRWAAVPLKATYRDVLSFGFDKPLLIIANKFNSEWGGPPVNYLDRETLDALADRFEERFTLVYNRPTARLIVHDDNLIADLDEKNWLKQRHPGLHLAEDLFEAHRHRVRNFNHFQLCLYAQAERFISVQGGNSVLASYFGGTNLIYQVRGRERVFGEVRTIYPKLSNARCLEFADRAELIHAAEREFAL